MSAGATTSKSLWPFSPQSIPGCELWLDGADTSSITGTSTVTAWKDKSGKGSHASGSGGLSYTAGEGITFNGSNGYFSVPGVANSIVGTPFTVFVVEKVAVLPSVGLPMGIFTNDPNANVQYGSFFTCYNNSGSVTFGWYAGDQTTSTTYSVGTTRMLNFNYTGSNRTILVNGTSGATESWTQNLITGAFTQPVIGRLWGTYYYNGTISELILYIGNINTQQYQQVEGYLAQKWGLQGDLPATHPYYATTTMQLYQRPVFQRTFQPVDIPGLSLWLDAADLTSLTISSGNVTAWRDKSGNGNNATATGTPTLSSSGGFSSSPQTIYLDGTSYFLGSANISSTTSLTALVVTSFALSSAATSARVLGLASAGQVDWNNTASSAVFYQDYGTSNLSAYRNGAYLSAAVGQNTPVIGTCVYDGTSNYLYKNGASQTPVSSTGEFGISIYGIGNQPVPSGECLNGYIGEVIVFNTALTSSQRQQVESYLAWKWRLVSPLSTGHPGKLLPSFSTTFTPKSISGCQLWLDAADSSTIAGTSPVTSWADKSGNGYTMNTLTGAPIGYSQESPTTGTAINGLNTVYFSPGAGLQQATTLDGVKNLYWVGRIDTTGVVEGGANCFFLLGHDFAYDWHGDTPAVGTYLNDTYSQAGIYNATPVSQYGGGAVEAVNTTFSALQFPASGVVSFVSAAGISGSTQYQGICYDRATHCGWSGDLAEVIIFSEVLTPSEHQQVEGYLAWKWGLQNNLPDTHAYKKIRP